jgi:hypothetical protein
MMAPNALPLVPLIRFSGFVWIIAVGLALQSSAAGTALPVRKGGPET